MSCTPDEPEPRFFTILVSFKAGGKEEQIGAEFAPDGQLWKVWSRVSWAPGQGPAPDVTVQSLTSRFGAPPMLEDNTRDSIVNENWRKSGDLRPFNWRAAWSSEGAPWSGSVNTHVPFKEDCKSLPTAARMKCSTEWVERTLKSWDTRLNGLRGVVTTVVADSEAGVKVGAITSLNTTMYNPTIVPLAEAAAKRDRERWQALMKRNAERQEEEDKRRDAEKLPKF